MTVELQDGWGQTWASCKQRCVRTWMPGRGALVRSLSFNVVDKKLLNFDLVFHSGLFYESGSPDFFWTYHAVSDQYLWQARYDMTVELQDGWGQTWASCKMSIYINNHL